MPFIHMDQLEKEYVTPRHSTAYGELVTGQLIEVGRLTYQAGEGATEHAHPQEQVLVVIRGRMRVTLDGETVEVGAGSGFHAPPNVPHSAEALADTEVLSCKSVHEGIGHRS